MRLGFCACYAAAGAGGGGGGVQYMDGEAVEGVMWAVWKSRVGREGLSQFPDPLLTDH